MPWSDEPGIHRYWQRCFSTPCVSVSSQKSNFKLTLADTGKNADVCKPSSRLSPSGVVWPSVRSGTDLIYGRWKCGGQSKIAHAPADCCCRRHRRRLSLAPSRGNYIRFHQSGCQQRFVTRKSGELGLQRDARSKHRHSTPAGLNVTSGNRH